MKTGRLHRLDGPAIEWINGRKEWCLNGNRFASEQKWFKALDKEDKINYLFK